MDPLSNPRAEPLPDAGNPPVPLPALEELLFNPDLRLCCTAGSILCDRASPWRAALDACGALGALQSACEPIPRLWTDPAAFQAAKDKTLALAQAGFDIRHLRAALGGGGLEIELSLPQAFGPALRSKYEKAILAHQAQIAAGNPKKSSL